MTLPAENKLTHPLEIVEARQAEYKASETQRKHADALAKAYDDLANAEYAYRTALSDRWKELKAEGWAMTTCGDIARGEPAIAELRRKRDRCEGEVEKLKELSYAYGADRRALDGIVDWSKHRDLRTDAPVPPGFELDRGTGELRRVA